jgi:hypothetical protein
MRPHQAHDTRRMSRPHHGCRQQGQHNGRTGVVDAALASAPMTVAEGALSQVGGAHDDEP